MWVGSHWNPLSIHYVAGSMSGPYLLISNFLQQIWSCPILLWRNYNSGESNELSQKRPLNPGLLISSMALVLQHNVFLLRNWLRKKSTEKEEVRKQGHVKVPLPPVSNTEFSLCRTFVTELSWRSQIGLLCLLASPPACVQDYPFLHYKGP